MHKFIAVAPKGCHPFVFWGSERFWALRPNGFILQEMIKTKRKGLFLALKWHKVSRSWPRCLRGCSRPWWESRQHCDSNISTARWYSPAPGDPRCALLGQVGAVGGLAYHLLGLLLCLCTVGIQEVKRWVHVLRFFFLLQTSNIVKTTWSIGLFPCWEDLSINCRLTLQVTMKSLSENLSNSLQIQRVMQTPGLE